VTKLAQEWDNILGKNAGEKEAIESEALLVEIEESEQVSTKLDGR